MILKMHKYTLHTLLFFKINMDTGTKAFLCAIYNDIFPCVINPVIMVWGSSNIQRKMLKGLKEAKQKLNISKQAW